MSKQPPPASTASAIGPCPTFTQIVGRPDTRSLPSTVAPPDHPQLFKQLIDVILWLMHVKILIMLSIGHCYMYVEADRI